VALSRKLAKQIREGTYEPSSIGKKAREVGSRTVLIREITVIKDALNSGKPKFNKTRSDKATREKPNGQPRSAAQLRRILDAFTAIAEGDDSYQPEEDLENDHTWFYYQ
jgi:hypothetical protein